MDTPLRARWLDDDTEPVLPDAVETDRRAARRRDVMVPARIDTQTRPHRIGVTCNLSRTGALLVTPTRFAIGERAVLKFSREQGVLTHEVQGRIVRLEINENDPVGVWRYRMAVRFAAPLPRAFVLDGGG